MLKKTFLILLSALCVFLSGKAMGGTFTDKFDAGALSEENWVIIRDTDGTVEVEGGGLKIEGGKAAGWNITGVRFGKSVDLTQGKLIIECDVITPASQFLIAFSTTPTEGDPWNAESYWAWLIAGSVWKWESNAVGEKAQIEPMPNIPIDQSQSNHYYLELSPTGDKNKYDATTAINDTEKASSTLSIAEADDPTIIYLYICVGDDDGGKGPTFVDNVIISSPSIEGVTAVKKGSQLAAKWGKIKSDMLH